MPATVTTRRSQPCDKHLAAIKDGLSARCLAASGVPPSRNAPNDPESARFAAMPLPEITRQCLLADGYSRDDLDAMSPADRAMLAFGGGPRASGRPGTMTSGSLREVTRDAVNKSLTAGYEEAPQTWRGPMRQAPSVSDFKDIHRIKLGSPDSLPIWPDNTVPRETRLTDEAEAYALEARAEGLSFSWRLFINDDLDALSRRPAMLGAAAARTVNQSAWAELTNRARKLADGQGLFIESPTGLRHRSNLTTGAGQPSNATLGAMRAKMRQMRGLNADGGGESNALLNLTPTYLACGTELEELVLKQVLSGADPAAGGNSAVFNTASTLTPVIEPLLDLDSATAFYLFASPNRVDTIEVTFLTGQETPITHEWMDDSTMSQHFTIIQTFAARAIDYRGIQKHAGA